MSLSCSCDFDPGDHDVYYYYSDDYTKLNTNKRKRCTSCEELINIGSDVVEFPRFRHPTDEIEERCKGDEIPLASHYLCEKCGEIFLNLYSLGYNCLDIYEKMSEYLKEYHEMTGFKPKVK